MSKRQKQKSSHDDPRVKVGKLGQQEKELKSGEAMNIRGGGGASGGVNGDRSEVPTNRLGR